MWSFESVLLLQQIRFTFQSKSCTPAICRINCSKRQGGKKKTAQNVNTTTSSSHWYVGWAGHTSSSRLARMRGCWKIWTVSNGRCYRRQTPWGSHRATRKNMVFWHLLMSWSPQVSYQPEGRRSKRDSGEKKESRWEKKDSLLLLFNVETDWKVGTRHEILHSSRQHSLKFWLTLFKFLHMKPKWSSSSSLCAAEP